MCLGIGNLVDGGDGACLCRCAGQAVSRGARVGGTGVAHFHVARGRVIGLDGEQCYVAAVAGHQFIGVGGDQDAGDAVVSGRGEVVPGRASGSVHSHDAQPLWQHHIALQCGERHLVVQAHGDNLLCARLDVQVVEQNLASHLAVCRCAPHDVDFHFLEQDVGHHGDVGNPHFAVLVDVGQECVELVALNLQLVVGDGSDVGHGNLAVDVGIAQQVVVQDVEFLPLLGLGVKVGNFVAFGLTSVEVDDVLLHSLPHILAQLRHGGGLDVDVFHADGAR